MKITLQAIDLYLNQPAVFYTLIGVLGLIVGSFLNVVIYRLPQMMEKHWYQQSVEYLIALKNEGKKDLNAFDRGDQTVDIHITSRAEAVSKPQLSLYWPPSHCPQCKKHIAAWENIPVISYLFLRGRCSNCKWPIPLRYPFVELLTALFSLTVAYYFGVTLQTLAALVFTWMLIALTFIDIDEQILPDEITLFGLWLGLLLSLGHVFVSPQDAILGAILGYLVLWLLYHLFKWMTHKEGMGYGDFKLLAFLGAWLGWQYLPLIILVSSFTATLWGLTSIALQYKERHHPIPFGPFLALGGWLTLMFGDAIVQTYLRWVY